MDLLSSLRSCQSCDTCNCKSVENNTSASYDNSVENDKILYDRISEKKGTSNGNDDSNSVLQGEVTCRQVGPLPHLSAAYFELPNGLPIVPRPARMLMKNSDEGGENLANDNTINVTQKEGKKSILQLQLPIMLMTRNTQLRQYTKQGKNYSGRDIVMGLPGLQNQQQTSNTSKDNIEPMIYYSSSSSFSPGYKPDATNNEELQRRRLQLWKHMEVKTDTVKRNNTNINNIISEAPEQVSYITKPDRIKESWVEYWDEEVGANYYYNIATGEACWVDPNELVRH